MKKNIILFTLILITSLGTAQSRDDRIKALKVALITEKLNLSESEAQKFWPIYNAFEDNNRAIRKEIFDIEKNINFDTLTEDNAKGLLKEINRLTEKKHQNFYKFMSDVQKVLPAKKVLMLREAEDEFKHKMFEEFKKRKQQRP